MLQGDYPGALRHLLGRHAARSISDTHIFVVFNICDAAGRGYHWTLAHCHVTRRVISYMDYWKKFHDRDQHILALRGFMNYVLTVLELAASSSADWTVQLDGSADMPVQENIFFFLKKTIIIFITRTR